MALIFRVIKDDYDGLQRNGGVFYDLGSGTGKPVFAALLHPFERVVGIETLSQLHTASLEITDHWRKLTDSLDDDIMSAEQKRCVVEFINDDIKNPEFSMADATIGFANSTCYDEELMINIAAKADEMVAEVVFHHGDKAAAILTMGSFRNRAIQNVMGRSERVFASEER